MPMTPGLSRHTMPIAGSDLPKWVHLLPSGTFSGVDGRGPYTLKNPDALIASSMASGKIPIDENHGTDLAAKEGAATPARGWIVEMDARADGIWGRVEWTAGGQTLVADRAYRWISPVFVHDKDSDVLRILRAALTNAPNLPQLTALHSWQGSDAVSRHADEGGETDLSAADMEVCRRMHLDPAQFAKNRKKMMAEQEGFLRGQEPNKYRDGTMA